MADVRDAKLWNERVQRFKEFADSVDAEFDWKRFGNGKECCTITQYYRPIREDKNGRK